MSRSQPTDAPRRDAFFWGLVIAAVVTRSLWALWIHPPQDHVFSDTAHYVHRARMWVSVGARPGTRELAWQAWGTHVLLALPMFAFGATSRAALVAAAGIWAACSAGTVVLGFRVAQHALPEGRQGPWPARAVGLALLGWIPLLSHAGYFVSETPFAFALLAMTLALVRARQTDSPGLALAAGLAGAAAFALRPQVAVFFVLAAVALLVERRRGRPLGARKTLALVAPLIAVLAFSMVRFRVHTGRLGGVAENATMNLTAGRCHNIVTHAVPDAASLAATQRGVEGLGRRVSLPGFRALARRGDAGPLALRPALGGESIVFIGPIGDPAIHRALRRRCMAATGVGGQLRYSVTNTALLWVVARPWPESSDHGAPWLLPIAQRGRRAAAALAPLALIGLGLALVAWIRRRDDPQAFVAALVALQLSSLLVVAAVFFGTPRLRTPYDPFALILVALLLTRGWAWLRRGAESPG